MVSYIFYLLILQTIKQIERETLVLVHSTLKLFLIHPSFYSGLHFEKAYCQYRLNRTQEALTTLRGVDKPDTRIKELLSQVV